MNIFITGGTGLIGKHLCRALLKEGHTITVLTRNPATVSTQCHAIQSLDEWQPDMIFDAVINLAGEPIVDKAWTKKRKQTLWDSRVTLTEKLVNRIEAAHQKPQIFLSGSAIGYYGNQADTVLDETSPCGSDFGAELCRAWENAAQKANTRVSILRTGLVLDSSGGLFKKLLLLFKLGFGGRMGNGKQWMSWIHIDDYVAIVLSLLNDANANGIYNMTAPNPVTNEEFTTTLAKILHRPAFFNSPTWILKSILGERANLVLGGQYVLPRRVQKLGYNFIYPNFEDAIQSFIGND